MIKNFENFQTEEGQDLRATQKNVIFHKTFADLKVNGEFQDIKRVKKKGDDPRPITSEE